jgi:putative salt-induced outer membrane protein YdiY
MRRFCWLALAGLLLAAPAAMAQEEEEDTRPWSDTAELSFVMTTGNSETENFAFSNEYIYNWSASNLTIKAAMLRTETTARILENVDGEVDVDEITETTAEAYYLDGTYRHDINETLYWYAGAGWQRNRYSGIDNRYTAGGGLGLVVWENNTHHFKIETGLDYTSEEQVGGNDEDWAGARLYFDYLRSLSETSKFESTLELLENLDETDDLRARWINSVTASINSHLALKASYGIFFDNEPVILVVEGDDPGESDAEFEFDDVDTILSASLVINF